MGSSRGGKEKKRELSDHELKLLQRLQEAMSIGIRLVDGKGKIWQCLDAEIQRYALRTMVAFTKCMSSAPLQHPLIKESVADMLVALGGILQSDNERILSLAMEVFIKLVSSLGTSIRQYHVAEVVFSLSRLLSLSHSTVTISSVIALNHILTNLGHMRSEVYTEVWKALENANVVGNISLALQDYVVGISSSECFTQLTSLLKTVLWKWPPSRYCVWSNSNLMARLGDRLTDPESTIIVGVLQLCSALALCANGALKILENEELLSKTVWALESSRGLNVRVEALKLCQQLLRSQEVCSKLTNIHCDSIVQGIVAAMSEWRSSGTRKAPPDQMILVKQACQSALMTRWAGIHHSYFWKLEVDRILLDVLIGKTSTAFENQTAFRPEDIMAEISSSSIEIRPYIWNILGWLAVHCAEDFLPNKGKSECLDALINIACSVVNELYKGKTCLSSNFCEVEPVSRAFLLMVFSPCKYISLKARTCMSEVARTSGGEYLEKLLASLMLNFSADVSPDSYSLHTLINLRSLACYSTLPLYQQFIVQRKGTDLLDAIIRRCLKSEMHVSRSIVTSHLHGGSDGKLCCWSNIEDWEGEDLILFHSLQILSQLIPFSNFMCDYSKIISREYVISNISEGSVESLFNSLRSIILDNNFSPGTRWYAQYVFSYFGLYGFPSKLGKRMEVALVENELADLQFLLSSGQHLRVHGAILVAGCPYLLPPKASFMKKNMLDCGSLKESKQHGTNFRYEVKLSERVDSSAFMKILEYIYTGYIIVEDGDVKPVRILAKRCGLNPLSYMLKRKLPEWGASVPSFYFSHVLEPEEHHLWDVILEANKMIGVNWTCSMCGLTLPHIHAHKIILWSNCGYLRALLQSGMSESYSAIIKVPVGFEALTKLVAWFYTGKLPRLNLDCNWNNMATNQQLHELQAYVELSSLAEFWLLKEVGEESMNVVLLCLELNQKLSMEIINHALELHQWRIVEAAVAIIAPLYPKMRDSGDLDNFSEEAVDLLRSEYVRYSQKGFSEDG